MNSQMHRKSGADRAISGSAKPRLDHLLPRGRGPVRLPLSKWEDQDESHSTGRELLQQLQRRPQRPVLGEMRPGLLQGGPAQRRGAVCDETALGRLGEHHLAQRLAVSKKLKAFVAKAPQREAEAREILKTAPGGARDGRGGAQQLRRHQPIPRSAKAVCAYAGLRVVVRQSGERKSKDLKVTKEGSGTLAVGTGGGSLAAGWQQPEMGCPVRSVDAGSGKKRAIVAVAKKLLCVLYAMLRTSTPYKIVTTPTTAPRTTGKESVRTSTSHRQPTTGRRLRGQLVRAWPRRRLQTRPQPWGRGLLRPRSSFRPFEEGCRRSTGFVEIDAHGSPAHAGMAP